MLRKTTTILAVAITTSGCGATATSAGTPSTHESLAEELSKTTLEEALARRDHFAPLCDSAGYPLPGNVNNKQGSGTSVREFCDAIATPAVKPEPDKPQPKPDAGVQVDAGPAPVCDRDALNKELSNELLDDAVRNHDHYRCLCDDKGYPLVGNINAKGTTASELCRTLKEKGLL